MTHTRPNGPWLGMGTALLGLALATACAPKTGRRQTEIMEKTGKVRVGAVLLRARVNDLADRFAARIERTADRIAAAAADPAMRRRALVLKVDAIPAVYAAAYRADPLTAAMDVWGFAIQFEQYFADGAGRDAFGSEQEMVRQCARELVADADALIRSIATLPEHFERSRATVETWARSHPVDHTFSSRASGAAFLTNLRSEDRDAFQVVGAVSDTIENLSDRLNTYATQLPRQARWQAELLIAETAGERGVERAFSDIHDVGIAARHASELLGDVPGLLGAEASPVRAMLAAERRAVPEGVDRQRVQTLEFVTAERLAVLSAARDERIVLTAALRQERIDALREVDAIKSRAVESALAGLRDLVDYTLWRVAIVCLGLMLAATALGVAAYRLTVGRRPA